MGKYVIYKQYVSGEAGPRENPKSACYIGTGAGKVYFEAAPIWEEKYKRSALVGSAHELLNGDTVLQAFDKTTVGDLVTLVLDGKSGALSVERAEDLQALCDAGDAVPFSDGDETFNVMFDYSKDAPIDLEYLDENKIFMKGVIYLRRAA